MTIGADASQDMLLSAAQKVEGRSNVRLGPIVCAELAFPDRIF